MNRVGLGLIAIGLLTVGVAAGPVNADAGSATYLDNGAITIQGNSALWYRFDYAGDRSEIKIIMPNGNGSGLAFNVFTPDEVRDLDESKPVGRGTAQAIDCETGEPSEIGECQADDLTWVGKFNAAATYYVELENYNPGPATVTLAIQGTGVTVGQ